MKVAIMKAAAPMTGGMSWLPVAEQARMPPASSTE